MTASPPETPTPADLARLEAAAEAAYEAMYDARAHQAKDCRDDALGNLRRAIEIAERLGLAEDAARLRQRLAHVSAVYDHQFRM
ncbi:MAG: hypothetical protein ACREFI_19980 [Stellaceae bacterium]